MDKLVLQVGILIIYLEQLYHQNNKVTLMLTLNNKGLFREILVQKLMFYQTILRKHKEICCQQLMVILHQIQST